MCYHRRVNDVIRIMTVRDNTSKLSDRVVVELQQRILSGELGVGSRLPTESELCEAFDVSRTVIRDALRTLTAMGLINVQHGHGISVTEPNDHSAGAAMAILLLRSSLTIGDVLDARKTIETELCSLAARLATDDDIAEVERRLQSFRAAAMAADTELAFDEHLAFHTAVYEAIRMPAMALLLRPMAEVILLSSFPPRLDEPELWETQAHERIAQALRARDEEGLRFAIERHFTEMEGPAYAEHRATPLHDSPAVHNLIGRVNRNFTRRRKEEAVG